jgi:hypothetical protein
MAKYRKRPVEVEAFQILMDTMRKRDYPQWFADAIASGVVYQKANPDYPVECTIRTLEGEMDANLCDYIIKGVNGELYPCKPDIFDKTYEMCSVNALNTCDNCNYAREVTMLDGSRITVCDGQSGEMAQVNADDTCDDCEQLVTEYDN